MRSCVWTAHLHDVGVVLVVDDVHGVGADVQDRLLHVGVAERRGQVLVAHDLLEHLPTGGRMPGFSAGCAAFTLTLRLPRTLPALVVPQGSREDTSAFGPISAYIQH